ncbi:permease prefix domain 1-containing protein [Cryobacterium sp. BB307]|uniref:permease prefix domain 1-containing protein n=1 Tax=Cryobacterium sp. BB307 TaxID=2716317 RepID=UPI0014456393|nr:permease prefix domain 1-containing protein [Cryobacterium sp. BB307]
MSDTLEKQIGEWRSAVLQGRAVADSDADELEGHLREQIADLEAAGLTADEAFLIAVRRLGEVNQLTAEFAREHGERLWKQLAISRPDEERRQPIVTMLAIAAVAAVLVQVARLLSEPTVISDLSFARNVSLFVLPVLAAYFAVVRRMSWQRVMGLGAAVALLAVAVNLFPFVPGASTELLVAIHLPVALWFVVGTAYLGGDLRSSARRMDFIRFTGEWVIYYALIALGGAVLVGLTVAVLSPIAPEAIESVLTWVIPSGAASAIIVAAWLVEAKKSVIENIAPVLTAIFTPLFAIMLTVSVFAYAIFGLGREFDRDLLMVFDLLLLVVLGLVVYGISARDLTRRERLTDAIRLVAVIAAVVLDLLVLVSMFARIGEFGFTANRVAALGLNIILLVNLVVTAWLIARLLADRDPAARVERWQTGYLPVFAGWVLFVVLLLPPLFGFA